MVIPLLPRRRMSSFFALSALGMWNLLSCRALISGPPPPSSLRKHARMPSALAFPGLCHSAPSRRRKQYAGSVGTRFSSLSAESDPSSGLGTLLPDAPLKMDVNGIFCNRELSMKQIEAVGFDMDYTLSRYRTEFDLLAYNGAKKKLVDKGYPEDVLNFAYDPQRFTRGLVIDKRRGNIIKMDRHKYVRVAYHGFREISSEERKTLYSEYESFSGSNFVNMDTLFSLVDCTLFAHLIDYIDKNPEVLPSKNYEAIFRDIRDCVDICHRDGVIKDRVAEDPARYIIPDPEMVHMIKRLRAAGKKTFLLTNSLWDYTNVVMNFLVGNEADARTTDWVEDLFDIVIVGACKPGFLVDPFLSLFRVNTRDNTLTNTDGIIGDVDVCLQNGRVFQGGNWQHLHEMLKLHSGDRLLYVGDHMFSDILRSKRTLGWRTCLIVPELEMELIAHGLHAPVRARINELREYQYRLDEEADRIRFELLGQSKPALEESLALVEAEQAEVKERLRIETLDFHHLFHPQWGQLFKSGYQDSRFAAQVTQYACIYTAKASNLYQMSGRRSFRAVRDFSAHDFRLESSEEVLDPELM